MQMFLNGKSVVESDLKEAINELGDLDIIELERVDDYGNLYFKADIFEPIVKFSQ
jgi:hypothetical protein